MTSNLLTQPTEITNNNVIHGLIYGQPGIGKTTLALSAPNPVLIDFDKGMKRVNYQHRVPSLQVDSWKQVLELIESDELEGFDTVIVDTLGKMVDAISLHIRGGGQMRFADWTAVRNQVSFLFNTMKAKGKSLIFVAHESEDKEGDSIKKRPDCAGQSRKDIIKDIDYMGYMYSDGGKRVIGFNPSDNFYAKNSLRLDGNIIVPEIRGANNFLTQNVFEINKKNAEEEKEVIGKYNTLIGTIENAVEGIIDEETANNFYQEFVNWEEIYDSKIKARQLLHSKTKEIGVEFNPEKRCFVSVQSNAPATVSAMQ